NIAKGAIKAKMKAQSKGKQITAQDKGKKIVAQTKGSMKAEAKVKMAEKKPSNESVRKAAAQKSGEAVAKARTPKYGEGSSMTIRDNKANVSESQLKASGLSLRAYMNAWKKTGKRPVKK